MTSIEPTLLDYYCETNRLFLGGFVAAPKAEIDRRDTPMLEVVRARFRRLELGGYSVLVAPDTPVLEVSTAGVGILAIGDIFDNEGDDPRDRLRAVAGAEDMLRAIAEMDLGGRHAILIVKGDDLTVFNDPFGSRSVHYFTDGRRAVASHAALLAELYNTPRCVEVEHYTTSPQYETRIVKYLPGNLSMFDGMRRLVPNHVYNTRSGAMTRFWPHEQRSEAADEEVFRQRFDAALDALRVHVADRYSPVVSLTGGIDTRVILTNFHLNDQPFTGVTWVDVNFKGAERETIDRLAALTGQPSHNLVRPTDDASEILQLAGAFNAGGLPLTGVRAKLMKRLDDQMASTPPPVFIMGYGGEILRGFYRTKSRETRTEVTPQSMLDMFGVSTKKAPSDREISGFVMRSFREFSEDGDFNAQALRGYDANDVFYWEHRMGMWATLTLETIDPAMHCLEGVNSRRLYEAALSLPLSHRMSKELLRRYIDARCSEMAAIPVV